MIDGWRSDDVFRSWFNALLAGSSFHAFRWETPPATTATLSDSFEFVLLDSRGLDREADASAFAEHLTRNGESVAVFTNLGRDATLVVPRPVADASAYCHLANFVRRSPVAQQHDLWRAVGQAMTSRIGSRPVWLSTAGAGVPWLHVRLDDRPKYYGFGPYRNMA